MLREGRGWSRFGPAPPLPTKTLLTDSPPPPQPLLRIKRLLAGGKLQADPPSRSAPMRLPLKVDGEPRGGGKRLLAGWMACSQPVQQREDPAAGLDPLPSAATGGWGALRHPEILGEVFEGLPGGKGGPWTMGRKDSLGCMAPGSSTKIRAGCLFILDGTFMFRCIFWARGGSKRSACFRMIHPSTICILRLPFDT